MTAIAARDRRRSQRTEAAQPQRRRPDEYVRLAAAGARRARRPMALDGEVAVPDEIGITHLDYLHEAMSRRRPERLAFFAFDLLQLDGFDLRRCPIEERNALLRNALDGAGCPRVVYVYHIVGDGAALLDAVRRLGAETRVEAVRCESYLVNTGNAAKLTAPGLAAKFNGGEDHALSGHQGERAAFRPRFRRSWCPTRRDDRAEHVAG